MLSDKEVLIGPHNAHLYAMDQVVDGEHKARGLVPRDYSKYPIGHYNSIRAFHAVDMPTIPQAEWSERLKDLTAQGARLSDVRARGNAGQSIPTRDQNGKGYCWAHSGTSAHLLVRAKNNLPYVSLSAYAIACIIKKYQDEGGWGAQGVDFQYERGVPSEQFWPQQSMSKANDKPETWANAAMHKITEGWIDLQAQQYDRNLSQIQVATCLLLGDPVVVDYNWWSHSVCAVDLVDGASLFSEGMLREGGKLIPYERFKEIWDPDGNYAGAGFGVRIMNSWGDSWSEKGLGVLAANKAWPDGAVALRVVSASDA